MNTNPSVTLKQQTDVNYLTTITRLPNCRFHLFYLLVNLIKKLEIESMPKKLKLKTNLKIQHPREYLAFLNTWTQLNM